MTFRVLSYNILCGGNDRLPLIAKVVRAQRPDAVALLEANGQSGAETLARDLGMHLVYGQANSEFAVAWMSYPSIEGSRNHRLEALANTLLEVGVIWNGVLLSLFAAHLIHGRTAADAHHRAVEVQAILDVLHLLAGQPHLLVGDFNAVHPGDPIGTPPLGEKKACVARHPIHLILEAGYVDCYRKLYPDVAGYTYTSHNPWLRLDYVFASPSITAYLCASGVVTGREAKQASDHYPIWAEFE
jgi:exodeoxyribonuclease-3